MADIGAIRTAIQTRLKTVSPRLTCYRTMPPSPILPAAIVAPATGPFLAEVTMDGAEDLDLVVLVLVQKVLEDDAQDALDVYLSGGAANIADAIDSGSTADWDYAMCEPARGYGQYVFGDGEQAQRYLGFEIPVEVGVS